MNAAARLVHQNILSRDLILTNVLSFKHVGSVLLIITILLSALGTIYVTQVTRDLHAYMQRSKLEQDRLHVEHGQLLLERSTLMMQTRVQQVAERKLGMIIPDHDKVVIVRSQ